VRDEFIDMCPGCRKFKPLEVVHTEDESYTVRYCRECRDKFEQSLALERIDIQMRKAS
jgi:hypothetical protein